VWRRLSKRADLRRPGLPCVFDDRVASVFVLVIGFTGAAQTVEPLEAYKAYLNASAKATSPEALFPFISADYKSVLQQAPKAEVAKMLSMSIANRRSE
jgi:hypothetical protein